MHLIDITVALYLYEQVVNCGNQLEAVETANIRIQEGSLDKGYWLVLLIINAVIGIIYR